MKETSPHIAVSCNSYRNGEVNVRRISVQSSTINNKIVGHNHINCQSDQLRVNIDSHTAMAFGKL
jgi:hypothetical protein